MKVPETRADRIAEFVMGVVLLGALFAEIIFTMALL